MGLLREAPSWRKLHMVAEMNEAVRLLAMSGLRSRYPNANEQELRHRLATLLFGPVVAGRISGRPVEETGI